MRRLAGFVVTAAVVLAFAWRWSSDADPKPPEPRGAPQPAADPGAHDTEARDSPRVARAGGARRPTGSAGRRAERDDEAPELVERTGPSPDHPLTERPEPVPDVGRKPHPDAPIERDDPEAAALIAAGVGAMGAPLPGEALPPPADRPADYAPDAMSGHLADTAKGTGGVILERVDCTEYPCIVVARSDSDPDALVRFAAAIATPPYADGSTETLEWADADGRLGLALFAPGESADRVARGRARAGARLQQAAP